MSKKRGEKVTGKIKDGGKVSQTTIEVEVGLTKEMKSVLKVAKFEIVRQLKKPAFWAAILLMPALMGIIFLISMASGEEMMEQPVLDAETVVAITDEAGVLGKENIYGEVCESREECIEKVKNGEVDLYYYIPEDFATEGRAEFYHVVEGMEILNNDAAILRGLLAAAAMERVDMADAMLLTGNYEIVENRLTLEGTEANALGKAVVPGVILVAFFMFMVLLGNRFLMAVVEEKENRISEMILTAVSAKHLIVGKILAMMMLGVIQIVILAIPVVAIVAANQDNAMIESVLSVIEIDPIAVTMNMVLFVAAVLFYAGTCVLVGSVVSTARDASSFMGPAIVAMVFPLYFMTAFMAAEPDMVVYILSYFPLSAPIALMLRSTLGTLGTTEFVIGLVEMVILAAVVIRMAVATFQKNAINFGSVKLNWRKK